MGVIKRGILGGFSGKVANVVGTSWKGIAVIKSLPLSVANPRTAGQVSQRNKFTQCVDVATKILVEIIKPLWDRFAQQMSGYNAWIQANIDQFDSEGMDKPQNVIISRGDLTNISTTSIVASHSNNQVTLNWTDNTGSGNALATDEIFVMVRGNTTEEIWAFDTGVARSAETVTVDCPGLSSNNVAQIWYTVRRVDGSKVANSTYTTQNIL